jgi:transposase-like protein
MERRTGTAKRLTPEEVEQIIALRIRGLSVHEVARRLDNTTRTVHNHWTKWRIKDAETRDAELAAIRAGYIAQQEALADVATTDAFDAKDPMLRARAIEAATKARMAAAKLAGLDVAEVEHTGKDGGPIEVADPKEDLLARLARLAPEESGE